MQLAIRLLEDQNNNGTTNDVALIVDYSSQYYFSRQF